MGLYKVAQNDPKFQCDDVAMRKLHHLVRVRDRLRLNKPGQVVNGRQLRNPVTPRQLQIRSPSRELSPIGTGGILKNIEEDQNQAHLQQQMQQSCLGSERVLGPLASQMRLSSADISQISPS